MQDINLLQNKLRDRSDMWDRRNMWILGGVGLLTALVIGAGAFLYFVTAQTQTNLDTLKAENAKIQSQLDEDQGDLADAKSYQAQLQNIDQLATSHVYWSVVFDEMQKSIIKKSEYHTISLKTDGRVHVEGITPTYTDMGKLVLSLSTNPNVKNLRLASAQRSSGATAGYNFAIDFTINLSLLIKK